MTASAAVIAFAVSPGIAVAATAGTGTATTTIQAGLLSVGTIGAMAATMNPVVGATANGTLPSAQWADATGSGAGWNGTVAISPLTATGTWAASSGAVALKSTTAGAYTDMIDGVFYTVKPSGTPSATTTPFTYTSNDSNDASGSGSATNGLATAVGSKGLTITFDTATYSTSASYTVMAGTQSANSLVIASAAATTVASTNTTSTAPTYTNNGSVLAAGSVVGTVNSAGAIKILSAALGTGASGTGYYTAAPGVTITADSNSWAKTYTGTVQYSIITGP